MTTKKKGGNPASPLARKTMKKTQSGDSNGADSQLCDGSVCFSTGEGLRLPAVQPAAQKVQTP